MIPAVFLETECAVGTHEDIDTTVSGLIFERHEYLAGHGISTDVNAKAPGRFRQSEAAAKTSLGAPCYAPLLS